MDRARKSYRLGAHPLPLTTLQVDLIGLSCDEPCLIFQSPALSHQDLLGLFLSLVVSSARAVTIDPSTGVRGSLSRGVRIWINHVILFQERQPHYRAAPFFFAAA